jgi:hypothetical protein
MKSKPSHKLRHLMGPYRYCSKDQSLGLRFMRFVLAMRQAVSDK